MSAALAFRPVKATARRAKVLLLGEAGSGKTHAALTFPKPAVIDAEGSIDWFADRFDFVAVPTKSYADVRDLMQQVRAGRVDCETLVIDSLTSIYNGLLNAVSADREDLRPLDWGRIKRKFSIMLDELYHQLPVNVVCIGWIKAEYAKPGDKVNGQTVKASDLVKVGETFDGDKKTLYAFDFVFKLEAKDGKHTATVLKSRSGKLKEGQRIADFSWKTIEPLLPHGNETWTGMTDDEQVARDRRVVTQDDERPYQESSGNRAADSALSTGEEVSDATLPGRAPDDPGLKRSASSPGSIKETTIAKLTQEAFAPLGLTGPEIGTLFGLVTNGRVKDADAIRELAENEARTLWKQLAETVCPACERKPLVDKPPHVKGCPEDHSGARDPREPFVEEELPL